MRRYFIRFSQLFLTQSRHHGALRRSCVLLAEALTDIAAEELGHYASTPSPWRSHELLYGRPSRVWTFQFLTLLDGIALFYGT